LVTIATSLGQLRNLCQFYNLHIYIYQCGNVGKDWFSSCWDIRRYRPILVESQHNPTLTQKLPNRFWPFFTRCRAISGAINVHIRTTIVHHVLKCQGAECRSFHKFCPKLVAMGTSLEISKKRSRSVIYTQNAFILWKDPADPEIICLREIIKDEEEEEEKKKEITEG